MSTAEAKPANIAAQSGFSPSPYRLHSIRRFVLGVDKLHHGKHAETEPLERELQRECSRARKSRADDLERHGLVPRLIRPFLPRIHEVANGGPAAAQQIPERTWLQVSSWAFEPSVSTSLPAAAARQKAPDLFQWLLGPDHFAHGKDGFFIFHRYLAILLVCKVVAPIAPTPAPPVQDLEGRKGLPGVQATARSSRRARSCRGRWRRGRGRRWIR